MTRPSYEQIMKMPPNFINWEAFMPAPKEVAGKNNGPAGPNLGPRATAFIAATEDTAGLSKWAPPLSQEAFTALAKQLMDIDTDVSKTTIWRNYWSQPLIEQGVAPALLKQYQKRILINYRQQIFQQLSNDKEMNLDSWIKRFESIPMWDHLTQVQNYAEHHGIDKAYEQLQTDTQKVLLEQQEKLLDQINEKAKNNELLTAFQQIERAWHTLTRSSAYDELGAEKADKLLEPLHAKIQFIKGVVDNLNKAIEQISTLALENVVIQTEAKQVLDHCVQAAHLGQDSPISWIDCIHYVNQPERVATIHERVLAIRMKECLAYLEDTALLRQAIRRITVYRVRKDLIEALFTHVIQSENGKSKQIISEEDQNCLMMLQEEYLHTLNRQMEQLSADEAKRFLDSFKADPVLAPLPPSKRHRQKNGFAKRELAQMHQHIDPTAKAEAHEEIPLHDIDCPIEMDILGEICQQLLARAEQQGDNQTQCNALLSELSKTYQWIQSPDFTISSPELIATIRQDYESVQQALTGMEPGDKKLDSLEQCYEAIQASDRLPAPLLMRLLNASLNRCYNLNEWLQTEYCNTLKAMLENTPIKTVRDKSIFYELSIKGRLERPIVGAILKDPSHAPKFLTVLQQIYLKRAS